MAACFQKQSKEGHKAQRGKQTKEEIPLPQLPHSQTVVSFSKTPKLTHLITFHLPHNHHQPHFIHHSELTMSSPSHPYPLIHPSNYSLSPIHYAVAHRDHLTLSRILNSIPTLPEPDSILTESESIAQEDTAERISDVIDRRHDIPHRQTPLHLAVRLGDSYSVTSLLAAGADVTVHNSEGWSPLQESLLLRNHPLSSLLVRRHQLNAWQKYRRRLPRLIAVLRRMRDFYMEISFNFESSVIPFINKIAPSDTYKIWKRDGNLRADTSMAGFDGLKIHRADQSFLFLGEGGEDPGTGIPIPSGTLLVLNRDKKKIHDVFENAGAPMSDEDVADFCSQNVVYRPGVDVTRCELVQKTNWRKQEKVEIVGKWKARVYEMNNVVVSFRSRKVCVGQKEKEGADMASGEQVLPLELDEDEDGFLVCDNPQMLGRGRNSMEVSTNNGRRHSSFVREDRPEPVLHSGRRSVDHVRRVEPFPERSYAPSTKGSGKEKEKEYVKNLRPGVWLTEEFPLRTEELLPMLDILANKVKAVKRLREVLTTKFPPGTFPVKVAIPVVPTVRVVITFTKFVELPPTDHFYTPLSSPCLLANGSMKGGPDEGQDSDGHFWPWTSSSSTSVSSWIKRGSSRSAESQPEPQHCSPQQVDTFTIPSGYTWKSSDDKSRKMKKSKFVRKSK